ncbi:hypothetical protein WDU94_004184, partial [Cyamophila willieti]
IILLFYFFIYFFYYFFSASLPYSFRFVPKGKCSYCCPINEPEDITFMLFTRTNPYTPDFLRGGYEMDLRNSHMNRDLTTVFYIHGFTEQATGESGTGIKDAYLRRDDFNIILVDWSSLSAFPWYTNAASNTKIVGHFIANFIRFLVSKGYPLERMHVIGFSLGAEIAGFAGKALDIGKLPRITGRFSCLSVSLNLLQFSYYVVTSIMNIYYKRVQKLK